MCSCLSFLKQAHEASSLYVTDLRSAYHLLLTFTFSSPLSFRAVETTFYVVLEKLPYGIIIETPNLYWNASVENGSVKVRCIVSRIICLRDEILWFCRWLRVHSKLQLSKNYIDFNDTTKHYCEIASNKRL